MLQTKFSICTGESIRFIITTAAAANNMRDCLPIKTHESAQSSAMRIACKLNVSHIKGA